MTDPTKLTRHNVISILIMSITWGIIFFFALSPSVYLNSWEILVLLSIAVGTFSHIYFTIMWEMIRRK